MTFAAPFGKTFRGVFGESTAVAATYTWYGVGGWHPGAPFPAEAAILPANVAAAYQPHWGAGTPFARSDAASYANSKLNIANPGTNDAFEGGAPTWSSTAGWTGGTNKYLRTGIIASATTWSYLFEQIAATAPGLNVVPFGAADATVTKVIRIRQRATYTEYIHGGFGGRNYNNNLLNHNYGMANRDCYYDGANVVALSAASDLPGLEFYLLTLNYNGSAFASWFDRTMAAWACFNVELTDNQMANIAWGMGKISGRVP